MATLMPASHITIEGVTHTFVAGDQPTISDISLTIPEGQFVSIIGPSGCGKTTLLNLIAGLAPLQRGAIKVAGQSPAAGRSDVAYMLARDCLLPWLDAQGNAEFGAMIRGMASDQRSVRARALLKRVGLEGAEARYPKQLSHGMRQRVALARTFCLQSSLLLMDEPFGALDAQTKLQLEDFLLSLWSEERRTVVFITHDLAEAVAISDRVLVMNRWPGRIQADIAIDLPRPRSVKTLQKEARYHELYSQLWSELEISLGNEEGAR